MPISCKFIFMWLFITKNNFKLLCLLRISELYKKSPTYVHLCIASLKLISLMLTYLLVMSPSRNFPARAELSYEESKPSRAGALQFSSWNRADNISKNSKFSTYLPQVFQELQLFWIIECKITKTLASLWYRLCFTCYHTGLLVDFILIIRKFSFLNAFR